MYVGTTHTHTEGGRAIHLTSVTSGARIFVPSCSIAAWSNRRRRGEGGWTRLLLVERACDLTRRYSVEMAAAT